jgi:MYXO-CTERM domain-containing protein
MRRAPLLALTLMLALPSMASAQATLVTGFGGPLDFGTDVLVRDDDTISTMVDLTPAFPTGLDFFGTRYTSLYVNTNGNFSFGGAIATFTPDEFPHAERPIIAAWWADVDTRGLIAGEPDRNLVYYALEPGRMVATWIDVGYFSEHVDLLNAFQIILTAAPGEPDGTFDVELRYNRCEWTTGDATAGHVMGLGGIAAQAGFDGGDMVNYLTLPGSRTSEVLRLCTTSNVDMIGVWQLHPRGAAVTAVCGNGLRETGETCDDGGRAPHDGCDENCHIDTPCYSFDGDGSIILPVDAAFLSFFDGGDANFPDANGADATGGIGGGGGEGGSGRLDGSSGGWPPCSAPMMDAYVRDAGSTPFPDVGRFDAGRRIDASAAPDTLSVTGSGCRCRAGGGPSGGGVASSMLVLVALALRRRRAR